MCNFAPGHDHVVQFYESDAFLASVVAPYLAANLRRGAAALAVCTTGHESAITAALIAAGHDVAGLCVEGRLVWRDARALLEALRPFGKLDVDAFEKEVEKLVGGLGARFDALPIHIFGEMVGLLWDEGKTDDAIRLEQLWNDLSQRHGFDLLCAYRVRASETDAAPLSAVCDAHSRVLRPEQPASVNVVEDGRNQPLRRGEREMVEAMRVRDQRMGDGLREEVAQRLFGLSLMCRNIRTRVPDALEGQVGELAENLDAALTTTLDFANQLAPVHLEFISLAEALQAYAPAVARLYGVTCTVTVDPALRDPERTRKELLYTIVEEVVQRAARDRAARHIAIELSSGPDRDELRISHDGDGLVVIGARDDVFRRLMYEVHALGAELEVRPGLQDKLQLICRW